MVEYSNNGVERSSIQEVKYIPSIRNEKVQELRPENDARKSDTLFLYFTVCTALLLILTGSSQITWASPAIVKLKSNDTSVNPLGRPITTLEISMLLGIPLFAGTFGLIFIPKLSDIIGHKKCLQAAGFAYFVSIISMALSHKIELIILFLSISVTVYTAAFALIPVYLTEICEDHHRTKFGCLSSVFIPLGNLYTYIVGQMFSYRNFTFITAVPIIFFLIFFFLTPETPVYLLAQGKKEECVKALKKLRSNKTDEELNFDLFNINATISIKQKQSINNISTLLKTKESRKGVMIGILLFVVRILSGVFVVTSLLAPIFNEAGTNLSGNTVAIAAGVVSVLSSIFPVFILHKFARKPILIASSVGVGLCVSILGLFFFLKHIQSSIVNQIQWLPVVCIFFYIILFSLGLGPIPIAVVGELFIPNIRSLAVTCVVTVSSFTCCLSSFSYPLLAEALGTHWCLWIFGFCCFLGAVLMYIILPETKGKTVLEIQEMLKQ